MRVSMLGSLGLDTDSLPCHWTLAGSAPGSYLDLLHRPALLLSMTPNCHAAFVVLAVPALRFLTLVPE